MANHFCLAACLENSVKSSQLYLDSTFNTLVLLYCQHACIVVLFKINVQCRKWFDFKFFEMRKYFSNFYRRAD